MARFEGRFITATPTDKRYDSAGNAEFFRGLFTSGVMSLGDNLRVEAAGGRAIQIRPGAALLEGYLAKVTEDAAGPYTMSLPESETIYRVVLRAEQSGPRIYAKAGTAAAAPALERAGGVYEMSLAQARVSGGAVTIQDERGDGQLCGVCRLLGDRLPPQGLVDAIYPVGSIYMSTSSINPGGLIGGTWEAWGAGRVPVGVNTADSDFDSAGKMGGSKTAQYPLTDAGYAKMDVESASPFKLRFSRVTGLPTYNSSIKVTGGQGSQVAGDTTTQLNRAVTLGGTTDAGNNMQPYITCYMWRRTA